MIKSFAEVTFAKGHRNWISFTWFTIAYAFPFIVFYEWTSSDIIIFFINCDDPINPITTRIIIWIRVNFISPGRKKRIYFLRKQIWSMFVWVHSNRKRIFLRAECTCLPFQGMKVRLAISCECKSTIGNNQKKNNERRTSKQLVLPLLVII